jgi:hypothetical protein
VSNTPSPFGPCDRPPYCGEARWPGTSDARHNDHFWSTHRPRGQPITSQPARHLDPRLADPRPKRDSNKQPSAVLAHTGLGDGAGHQVRATDRPPTRPAKLPDATLTRDELIPARPYDRTCPMTSHRPRGDARHGSATPGPPVLVPQRRRAIRAQSTAQPIRGGQGDNRVRTGARNPAAFPEVSPEQREH